MKQWAGTKKTIQRKLFKISWCTAFLKKMGPSQKLRNFEQPKIAQHLPLRIAQYREKFAQANFYGCWSCPWVKINWLNNWWNSPLSTIFYLAKMMLSLSCCWDAQNRAARLSGSTFLQSNIKDASFFRWAIISFEKLPSTLRAPHGFREQRRLRRLYGALKFMGTFLFKAVTEAKSKIQHQAEIPFGFGTPNIVQVATTNTEEEPSHLSLPTSKKQPL